MRWRRAACSHVGLGFACVEGPVGSHSHLCWGRQIRMVRAEAWHAPVAAVLLACWVACRRRTWAQSSPGPPCLDLAWHASPLRGILSESPAGVAVRGTQGVSIRESYNIYCACNSCSTIVSVLSQRCFLRFIQGRGLERFGVQNAAHSGILD